MQSRFTQPYRSSHPHQLDNNHPSFSTPRLVHSHAYTPSHSRTVPYLPDCIHDKCSFDSIFIVYIFINYIHVLFFLAARQFLNEFKYFWRSLNVVLSSAVFLCLSDDFIETAFSIFPSSFSLSTLDKARKKRIYCKLLVFKCSNFFHLF